MTYHLLVIIKTFLYSNHRPSRQTFLLQVQSHLSHLGVQTLTQAAFVDVVQDAASVSSSLLDPCTPDRKP